MHVGEGFQYVCCILIKFHHNIKMVNRVNGLNTELIIRITEYCGLNIKLQMIVASILYAR